MSAVAAEHLTLLQCTTSLACCRTLNTATNKTLGKGSVQKHKFSRITGVRGVLFVVLLVVPVLVVLLELAVRVAM